MCGRMSAIFTEKDALKQKKFMISKVNREFSPRYNLAPSQDVPVIVPGSNVFDVYKWGLIPHWAKDKTISNKLINARSETLMDKPSFRESFEKRRCLVLSSGFFEWDASKTPFYIKQKDTEIMAFAGLYDEWMSQENEIVKTCTIITTNANDYMKKYHKRMPVILQEEQYQDWLSPQSNLDTVQAMLKPCDSSILTANEVSSEVNSPKNNYPEILIPISSNEQQTL